MGVEQRLGSRAGGVVVLYSFVLKCFITLVSCLEKRVKCFHLLMKN